MSKVYFFSHSRAEADSFCKRKRYLSSEWGNTGLQPTSGGWDLIYGNIIHAVLNILAGTGAVNYSTLRAETYTEASKVLNENQAKDYAVLAEGMLRGFAKTIWPRWMNEYDIVETEQLRSWILEDPHVFRFKQDLLLIHKTEGYKVMVDYKTTSSDSPQWVASWSKSPQLHSSMEALRKGYGVEVRNSIIQGLYKGYKDKKTGRISSIFAKGWVNRQFAMSPEYSYSYKNYKGWEPFSTYDEFPDLSEWIANMPTEKLAEQFPQTGPIFPNQFIADTYFRQQLIREKEVAGALNKLHIEGIFDYELEEILDAHFPQDFHKCTPPYGFGCEFENLCWIPFISADPLGSGQYIRRTPQIEDGKDN